MQEMGSSPRKSPRAASSILLRLLLGLQRGLGPPAGTHLIVGETGSGEDGDLLAPGDAVHHVDGRDPSLDHLLGVDAAVGVDGLAWSRKGK